MKTKSDYEQALLSISTIDASPRILATASEVIQDPDASMEDVENVLKADVAITADVMRLANSAFYGFTEKTSNFSTAAGRIGLSEVQRLIGVCVARKSTQANLSVYGIQGEDLWADSLSTAILMEILAGYMIEDAQDAYTIGLLHSLGKVGINTVLEQSKHPTPRTTDCNLVTWEIETVGFDFGYAGALMLEKWDFPKKITQPIKMQNGLNDTEEMPPLAHALYFCNQLFDNIDYGFKNRFWEPDEYQVEFLRAINLDDELLADVLEKAEESFKTIQRVFSD